jgi:hypothetical protein
MTEATRRRDALLDAIAYANTVYRGDQEAWEAILDANWSYPSDSRTCSTPRRG